MEKIVVCIGREFGSGGKAIAQLVADKLGVKMYDKELMTLAAEEGSLCKEVIESHDEKAINNFFYSLTMNSSRFPGISKGTDINQQAFMAQFDAIKKLADRESCVIVGRCADYALSDNPNMTSVFINADIDEKISLVSQLNNVDTEEAMELIKKTDKQRATYYNFYSNKTWGAASTYDLCINSSKIGYDGAAEAIINFIKIKEKLLQSSN